jgi:hypothetical protein
MYCESFTGCGKTPVSTRIGKGHPSLLVPTSPLFLSFRAGEWWPTPDFGVLG